MAYILIYDLDGSSAERRRMGRRLRRCAQMVQHSVWRFREYGALLDAAERVLAADGKVLAFVESDRILIRPKEVRQFLHGAFTATRCPK